MNTNHDYIRLIKNLFKDQLRRKEIGILSEMTIIEDRMKEQWDESENAFVDPAVGEHMWNQILKKYKKGPKQNLFLKLRPLAAACIALLIIAGSYILYQYTNYIDHSEKIEYIEIAASESMLYQLPDSSKVWMQPKSSIRFAKKFTQDRRVWLKGNSLFDVYKHQGSTFRVYIEKAFIEVKGTKFLIERSKLGIEEITLFNGCIEFNVESTGLQTRMKPLEQMAYNPSNAETHLRKMENIEWQNGKFKFNAMPLKELIFIINKMYSADVVFQGQDANFSFTGSIRSDESLDEVINKLCFIKNLKRKNINGKIILSN